MPSIKSLLATLKSEHEFILGEILALDNFKSEDAARLLALFQFVEFTHHEKEENILFPWISKQNWLAQGGPLCGYFMGLRLDLDPMTRIREHLVIFTERFLFQPDYTKSFNWLSPQNPLSIPMEEHELGHLLSQALSYFVLTVPEASNENLFTNLLQDYFSLLKLHIHKEDHCLFVQCEQRLI